MTNISYALIAFSQTLHFTSTSTGQPPYCQPTLAHHPTRPTLPICYDIPNSYLDTSNFVCLCVSSLSRADLVDTIGLTHRLDSRAKSSLGIDVRDEACELSCTFLLHHERPGAHAQDAMG